MMTKMERCETENTSEEERKVRMVMMMKMAILVLEIDYRSYHGRGTKDTLGGQGAGRLKTAVKARIYLIFANLAFYGRWIKVDF